jgi:hypothetical protein
MGGARRGIKPARGAKGLRGGVRGRVTETLSGFLSPLTIFAFCLGAGTVGQLVPSVASVSSFVRIICAIIGGIVFHLLIVQPLITLVMRFASDPAENLKSVVHHEAEVISRFDATGRGIVCLTIDGQKSRVLATLIDVDPSTVFVGDKLVVMDIDSKRNTCRVTRL